MPQHRSTLQNALYSLTRLAPVVAPLLIIPGIPDAPQVADLIIKRLLILTALVITWNMAEGSMTLWMRAKATSDEREKSYLFVTFLFGAVVVAMLQFFRGFAPQEIFILTLATLSARGIARSAWDNSRAAIGFGFAVGANTLLTLLSFMLITSALDWQSFVCALAIGSSIGSVEAQWNADRFPTVYDAHWPARLFRLSVAFGPVAIATLAMSRQLQWHYVTPILILLASRRLMRETVERKEIPPYSLLGAHGVSALFLIVLGICRAWEAGILR